MVLSAMGVVLGMGIAFQTAVNTRLRGFLQAPFLASFVSFSVGLVFLAVIAAAQGQPLSIGADVFRHSEAWVWTGGILGMFALTANILLFPKLGGVQTAVMSILGQVVMAMLIDQFAWFHAPQRSFGAARLLGVCLVLAGVFAAVVVPSLRLRSRKPKRSGTTWIWQLAGIGAGVLLSSQAAINAQLARELHSSVHAAFVSFAVGDAGLLLTVLFAEHSLGRVKNAFGKGRPWWIWIGGALGACYVFGSTVLVPAIGTGSLIVLVLCGLISGSLMVDHWGLFGALKKHIMPVQIVGLAMLLAGVGVIQLVH